MNDFIPWISNYETGIKEIDEQHKKLLNMLNVISEAVKRQKGHNLGHTLLQEMMEYSITHFNTEEEYMKKAEYPDLVNHIKLHSYFIKEVNYIYNRYINHKKHIDLDILHFLKNWWIDHILTHDLKYTPYLRNRN